MVELEAFETRFAAAFGRYLDEAPTEIDVAAVARTVFAARRSAGWRASWWSPLPATTTTVAWLALLLLLLAAVGAALIIGMRPPDLVAACPFGTEPDRPGPADHARPWWGQGSISMAFDRSLGSIVLATGSATWTFDVCTNTWSRAGDGVPVADPDPGRIPIVYDTDSNLTIAVDHEGRVWTFDVQGKAWSERDRAPWSEAASPTSPGYYRAVRLVYADSTGDVLALRGNATQLEVWSYDVVADHWQPVALAATPWPAGIPAGPDSGPYVTQPLAAWDAAASRLLAFRMIASAPDYEPHGQTILFDPLTGSWSKAADAPSTKSTNLGYGGSGGEISFADSVTQTVVFSDGLAIGYDSAANRWEVLVGTPFRPVVDGTLPTGPQARLGHELTYDPVNRRLVVLGGSYRTGSATGTGWVTADDVWAFAPAEGQWIELLAPSVP